MEWGEELHLEECTVPGPSLYTTVVVLVFFQSVCGFYGTQNDCLNLTVSAQKSVLKTEQRGLRYLQKCFETGRAKPNRRLKTVFD